MEHQKLNIKKVKEFLVEFLKYDMSWLEYSEASEISSLFRFTITNRQDPDKLSLIDKYKIILREYPTLVSLLSEMCEEKEKKG